MLSAGYAEQRDKDQEEAEQVSSVALNLEGAEDGVWRLTGEEVNKLRDMILEEERRDTTQDLLDVILVVLNDQVDEKGLTEVLEFLLEELKDALAQGEFRFPLRLIRVLAKVRGIYKTRKPWALPALDRFFTAISGNQVLELLSGVLPTLDVLDSERMKMLREFILLLGPGAILVLGPMLTQIRSPDIQKELTDLIRIMAQRDIRPLEELLTGSDDSLVLKLIYVLGQLEGEESTRILRQMIRHDSPRVRERVLRHLVARNSQILEELFPLIEDPKEPIRRLLLDSLGQDRSVLAERLLLDYLGQRRYRLKAHEHLLACYRALGRCGSSRSIPFLKRVLFRARWLPELGKSVHRRGAAIALIALGTEEAKETLHRASRSLFPSVRLAYRKALEASQ
jgi:hypothetical protein